MTNVVQTHGLCKKYKQQFAVDHADMNIAKGDIYGFVGENGSGKTTIIRLITGLIRPHSGSFELFGIPNTHADIHQARRRVGAIVENPSIYQNMSAADNLKMQCIILGIRDESLIPEVLAEVGLSELYGDKKHVSNFSLGMRQRLGIAMALLGKPEFLILDEPMNGLDPAGIVEIRELILRLNRERGITFLISSHILTELALVATKYGIISKGRILKEITAEQLHKECGKNTRILCDRPELLWPTLQNLLPAEIVRYIPGGIAISGEIALNPILRAIMDAGIRITAINCTESSFEDYYLSMIGGAKHD